MPTTSWRAHPIAALGLTIDLVDGPKITEGDGGGQHYVLQGHDAVVLAVRIGNDMTLAWWRSNFGERKLAFGAEASVTICGRAGRRQEVAVPTETATGLVPTDGGIGHIYSETPAHVHIAMSGLTSAGTPFVATWVVDAGRRDSLRIDEDHFFSSIRCP